MTRSPAQTKFQLPMTHRVNFGIGVVVTVCVLCYFFPPLRVVRLASDPGDQPSLDAATGPKAIGLKSSVHQFWDSYLPAARGRAKDIQKLFDAIESNPRLSRDDFSRQVGLGNTYFYFVRGSGDIEEITPNKVILTIKGHQRRARIETGMIVGNTVCDSTGWIDVNQFTDLQSFNDLSSELNRQIESAVLTPLRDHYKRGMRLEFVGCARINDESDLDPMTIVPVWLKIVATP